LTVFEFRKAGLHPALRAVAQLVHIDMGLVVFSINGIGGNLRK